MISKKKKDWCLYKLSKTFYQNVDPFSYLVLLSSSWVMIVFSTRPFSNTSEMTILTLCATIILTFDWVQNKSFSQNSNQIIEQ